MSSLEQAFLKMACKAFQQCHSAYKEWQIEHEKEWQKSHTPQNVVEGHELADLTVRQIADKLGISLGEVRRRKLAGTL